MTETEQRYHSNKQEFLALKWAVTEQFHEYLSPYGKNRNEFVVWMDNNPLTYIFSLANLDAAGQRWVAQRGNPPRNKGPGWEAAPQLLVPQPPSAQFGRLLHARLWTRCSQRPHGKKWEDYPPWGQPCQGSPIISPGGRGRNYFRWACLLPDQP